MILTAGVIAELIGGSVDGDPHVQVSTVSPIDSGLAGSLSPRSLSSRTISYQVRKLSPR